VLGLAARHHPEPIRAFTLTFDRPEYNEGEIAREMAAKAQAQFFPIPIKQDDLADNFGDAIHQAETFCVNGHGVAKFLLSRAVRDLGYKVVITGEGSDEILGGYMHFRRDMTFHKPSIPAVNGSRPALDAVNQSLGFVPGWIETAISLSTKMHAVLSKDFIAATDGRVGFSNFIKDIDVSGQLTGRHPLHQSLYLWSKTRLPNYILTLLGDRMEMAHSIEGRVPFLDHHLVELMRSQPVTQKIRGVTQKYILRESVRDVITDTVYRRHKHPFLSPPATLNQQSRFNILLQDTLRGPALTSMPFFDAPKVLNLLDGLYKMDEASRVANDQVLMTLLSACVLQDRFQLSV
jgi:asparagine synthase (glutamine-hydrolysing)